MDDVEAAALYVEHRWLGLRSRVVATADPLGFRSVIAPVGKRAEMASVAACALMVRGAEVVLASFECAEEPDAANAFSNIAGVVSGLREREVPVGLGRHAVTDLIVRQKSVRSALLLWASRLFGNPNRVVGPVSFLANALCDSQLRWSEGVRQPQIARPVLGKRASVLGEATASGRTA